MHINQNALDLRTSHHGTMIDRNRREKDAKHRHPRHWCLWFYFQCITFTQPHQLKLQQQKSGIETEILSCSTGMNDAGQTGPERTRLMIFFL